MCVCGAHLHHVHTQVHAQHEHREPLRVRAPNRNLVRAAQHHDANELQAERLDDGAPHPGDEKHDAETDARGGDEGAVEGEVVAKEGWEGTRRV